MPFRSPKRLVSFTPLRWSGDFSFSRNGLLVFQTGSARQNRQLKWFGLDGKSLGIVGEPSAFQRVAIAPNGRRAAVTIFGPAVWMYDLARGLANPFTFGNEGAFAPLWSPDGHLIAYGRTDGSILVKSTDSSSEPRTLASGFGNLAPMSWSPDARFIAFRVQDPKTGRLQIWMLSVDGSRKPYPFPATPANELNAAFSPDGRRKAARSSGSAP